MCTVHLPLHRTWIEMSKEYARIKMDLAFGSSKSYGSSRSIVRRIAASLPLKPCTRVQFQLCPYTGDVGFLNTAREKDSPVASLADVGWISQHKGDDEDFYGSRRSGLSEGLVFRTHQPQPPRRLLNRRLSLPNLNKSYPDPQGSTTANDEAIQKIGALETELAKLRDQIAQIVVAQEKSAQLAPAIGPPAPPPPPPPPAPPPPPPPSLQRTFSAIDLIKQRKGKKTGGHAGLEPGPRAAEVPSMLDVLKDIDKVKLRSVKSRPGDVHAKASEPTDAASLIAKALKRKFAHRYRHNSSQEETDEFRLPAPEVKPQHESPLFGQHMLKSTGKKKFL